MKTIRDYLESLFLGVADSPHKEQLKADLLANMEDRYNELIAEGKGEHEAIGITITEFGSIDELIENGTVQQETPEPDFDSWHDAISREEALDFLEVYRKSALKVGLGVLFCIIAVAQLIFLAMMGSEFLGLFLLMPIIAIGVAFFIVAGMAFTKVNKTLDDRPIPRNIAQMVAELKNNFSRSFALSITLGVLTIIFSVGFVFLGDYMGITDAGVSMMLLGVGFGVTLLVYGGVVQGSFEKLTNGRIFVADEDSPGPRARQASNLPPLIKFINGFYWPLILVLFFVGGFVFDAWAISWLVFPIGGILQSSIESAFER